MAESSLDRACRRLRSNDRTLQELYLNYNQISDKGVSALAIAMKGNTTLRLLSLYNNQISDKGATALAQAMKGNTTLHILSLSCNKISDKGATALAIAMKGNTTLRKLFLENNQISDEGATALAQAIKGNTTLQVLWLDNNQIRDEGVTALARALEGNTSLQELWLDNNQISDEGVTAMAQAMEGNTSLQELLLRRNQISDEGVTALAQAMEGNTSLQVLLLGRNQISAEGATALARALKGNTTLQKLDLGKNQISDEGVTALASLLHGNTKLSIYACGRWIKPSDKDTAAHDGEIAPSYDKLIKINKKDVDVATRLLGELSSFIEDVHEMKIYYTYVACYYRMSLIEKDDAGTFIKNGLLTVSTKCQDRYSVVMFKLINEKAYEDGYLTRWDFHDGDQLAEHAGLQPKFESLVEAIRANTACIEGLEANLVAVNKSVNQMSLIEKDDAGTFIKNGLLTVSTKCQDRYSVVMFKLINEKAYEDGYLTRWDFHDGDQLAEHAGLQPKFESLVEAIRANTACIEGLEANLVAVNKSVNQIRKGLQRKYRIEAVTGFIRSVINAISMGIGGGLVDAAAAFHSVIDFGDIDHLKENFADNEELLGKVNEGLALADKIVVMAEDNLSDSKLKNVVNNEKDVVIGLVVAAKLVQQPNWSGNLGISPTHPPFADGTAAEATIPESGAVEGDNMFADAELAKEDERRLPLHAAIMFGEKDYLKELLETMDQMDVNQLDSKERTAADFAALCREGDLLELIKSHGGTFHVNSEARMRAIARKRAPDAAQCLNSILEAL